MEDSGPAVPQDREALSKLREGSPAKLRRRLSGDLDTIVLQAMRKDPLRRYVSVEQFAEDIRRHLEGLPVTARRDSWRYRAGKFAIRHKLGVAATALVLTAVLGGIAATVREARIAAANERRAEQRFNDVRKLANSLMFEIHDAIRDLPGSTPARRLLVTRALEYLDSLSEQSKGDISLQKELAVAYQRVGDVLGYTYAANLGDASGALSSYRKALAIREPLAAAAPNDLQLQQDLVSNYFQMAQVLESNGNFSEALEALRKAMPTAERISSGSKDPVRADQYAGGYYFTAAIQIKTGDLAGAQQNYQRAAAIRGAALQAHPENFFLRTHQAADYAGIAECAARTHDMAGAIQMQAKATAILDEVSRAHPSNATLREYLGEATNRLATYRIDHRDLSAALETYRTSHQIFGELVAAEPKNPLAKSNFGFSDNGIARSLMDLGKLDAAAKVFRESIAIFEEMSPGTTSNRYPRTGLAQAYSGLGDVYLALAAGKRLASSQRREYWQEARSSCQKSLAVWNEKEKRGEMESGEREEPPRVTQCVAQSESHLRAADAK
jgi:non-specific serine/threonine protein kinase/serine/threonine-protein kinase